MRGEAFEQALEAIYGMALSPDGWPHLLAQLGLLFRSHFAAMLTSTRDRTRVSGAIYGLTEGEFADYLRTYHTGNAFGQRVPSGSAGDVMTMYDILPREQVLRLPYHADFLGPHEYDEGLRFDIWTEDDVGQSISLCRPARFGAPAASELALARRLVPHLHRATLLARRMEHADLLATGAFSTFETLAHAMLLLDHFGRPAYANPAAQRLLRAGDGLRSARDGLEATRPEATSALHRAMRLARGDDGPPRGATVRLPRDGGRPPLAAVVMPIRDEALSWTRPRLPAAILCVSDPLMRLSVSERHLATLFGFTAAEARLANLLLSGDDLAEIARAQGRSPNTLRTHLARLMTKTGTNRQTELVRLLMLLPRTPEAD